MLKIDAESMQKMEIQHRGIARDIQQYEDAVLPVCRHCSSPDTANVQTGMVGRNIYISTATTKFKLVANLPKPGEYFCNSCERFFS